MKTCYERVTNFIPSPVDTHNGACVRHPEYVIQLWSNRPRLTIFVFPSGTNVAPSGFHHIPVFWMD